MITGTTRLVAHIGYPTKTFKSPMIYNPYFESIGVDAIVVPMGSRGADFPGLLKAVFTLTNIAGALITMPHKVTTIGLAHSVSVTARIAGAANAVRREADGTLACDMFDGEGFVRGLARKGCVVAGARALVVGSGGVGSAIAASLAAAGVAALGLDDVSDAASHALAGRLRAHYPALVVTTGSKDPDGYGIVVNATPVGMNEGDPLPLNVARVAPGAYVGEVVLAREITPFLAAAREKGCTIQVGTDMLFEQIPAYLDYFGFPTTTPDVLRSVARIAY